MEEAVKKVRRTVRIKLDPDTLAPLKSKEIETQTEPEPEPVKVKEIETQTEPVKVTSTEPFAWNQNKDKMLQEIHDYVRRIPARSSIYTPVTRMNIADVVRRKHNPRRRKHRRR